MRKHEKQSGQALGHIFITCSPLLLAPTSPDAPDGSPHAASTPTALRAVSSRSRLVRCAHCTHACSARVAAVGTAAPTLAPTPPAEQCRPCRSRVSRPDVKVLRSPALATDESRQSGGHPGSVACLVAHRFSWAGPLFYKPCVMLAPARMEGSMAGRDAECAWLRRGCSTAREAPRES